MQRKNLYYFFILFLITGRIFSFDLSPDSLLTSKIDSILNKSSDLIGADLESSLSLAREGLKLSQQLDYTKGLRAAYHLIGTNYLYQAKNDSALSYLSKAVEYSKITKNKEAEANAYNNIGYLYDGKDDFDNAVSYYDKALKLYTDIKDSSGIATYYINMSIIFGRLNDFQTSLEYLIEADEIARKINDIPTLGTIKANISGTYVDLKNYKKALDYINEAKKIFRENNDFDNLAFTYSLQGYIFSLQKQYQESSDFYDSAYVYYSICKNKYQTASVLILQAELNIESHKLKNGSQLLKTAQKYKSLSPADKANVFYLFGKVEYLKSNYSKSEAYLQEALTFELPPDELELPRDIYNLLFEIKKKRNDYKKALDMFLLYDTYKDSLKVLKAKRESYNFEKVRSIRIKEKELENLQREQKIKQLEFDNQRLIKNFFIISSVFLLFVFLIGAYQLKKIYKLNQSLEKFNRQKEKFLRIISHDIKNSLGAVLNFSELILNNIDILSKEELVTSTKEINRAAASTNNLLTNLLEWSLTLNNEKEFAADKINLKELVEEGISSSVSSRMIKKIECTVNVPKDINVTADRNSIISVIRNLCTNAIKFSHENSTIKLYAKKLSGFAEVTIEDEGVGIAEEDLRNLFSTGAGKSTRGTMNEKGTGLGLSLVKAFVKNNGGEIRVESEIGKGSKFIFTVPLA